MSMEKIIFKTFVRKSHRMLLLILSKNKRIAHKQRPLIFKFVNKEIFYKINKEKSNQMSSYFSCSLLVRLHTLEIHAATRYLIGSPS